jgi:hypothetical protein
MRTNLGAHDFRAGQSSPVTDVAGQAEVGAHLAGVNYVQEVPLLSKVFGQNVRSQIVRNWFGASVFRTF